MKHFKQKKVDYLFSDGSPFPERACVPGPIVYVQTFILKVQVFSKELLADILRSRYKILEIKDYSDSCNYLVKTESMRRLDGDDLGIPIFRAGILLEGSVETKVKAFANAARLK